MNLDEDQTRAYTISPSGLVCRESPGCIVSGIAAGVQLIDTDEQTRVVGVVFRPGGTLGFYASPGEALTDCDVPLEPLWGVRATARLREALLAASDRPPNLASWSARWSPRGGAKPPFIPPWPSR